MDFSRFTTISFDCYGTLIDWESGILPTLANGAQEPRPKSARRDILELYGEFEAQRKAARTKATGDVLQSVVRGLPLASISRPVPPKSARCESVPAWPPFPDTVAALASFKSATGSSSFQTLTTIYLRRRASISAWNSMT
jgi:2-haloacid dehalogenase